MLVVGMSYVRRPLTIVIDLSCLRNGHCCGVYPIWPTSIFLVTKHSRFRCKRSEIKYVEWKLFAFKISDWSSVLNELICTTYNDHSRVRQLMHACYEFV